MDTSAGCRGTSYFSMFFSQIVILNWEETFYLLRHTGLEGLYVRSFCSLTASGLLDFVLWIQVWSIVEHCDIIIIFKLLLI